MVEKKDAKVRVDVSCLAVEGNEMKKVNTGQKKKHWTQLIMTNSGQIVPYPF